MNINTFERTMDGLVEHPPRWLQLLGKSTIFLIPLGLLCTACIMNPVGVLIGIAMLVAGVVFWLLILIGTKALWGDYK